MAELVTIIVGVLVALQVDSWRTARAESVREVEQLTALAEDFTANRDRYATTMVSQEGMLALSRSLLRTMDEGAVVPSDSLARMVFLGALSWYEVEPVNRAYDALIASGDIGLIQDPVLRRELAEFSAELEAGFEDQDNIMDILAELQRQAAPDVLALLPSDFRDFLGLSSTAREVTTAELLSNDAFQGLLVQKTVLESLRLARQQAATAAVERILVRIEVGLSETRGR